MVRKLLAIAAALLISFAGSAKAVDGSEQKSKNAQKLLATLNMVGINNQVIKDFITEADSHVDKQGNLKLTENKIMGGTLSLRCDVNALPSARRFELRYTPDDSHFNFVARTNIIEVGYRLKF